MKNFVIVIVGATGVGKTETSINVAKECNGEIISADSMQIYKHMNIGTAKPDLAEMQGIPHHMIDVCEHYENFSAALYKEMAEKCIDDILSRGKMPIVAGGTGLYIDSLFAKYEFGAMQSDEKIRNKYENIAKEKGNEYLHSLLFDIDKKSYEKIHFNNVKRVIRALEIYEITGKSLTENNENKTEIVSKYTPIFIGLTRDRQILYDRIDSRVEQMLENGLVNEVKMLYNSKNKFSQTSLCGIGYKEIIYYLRGLVTYDECIRILKRDTRHYAKRQLTWFNKNSDIKWFDLEENSSKDVIEHINNTKKILEG